MPETVSGYTARTTILLLPGKEKRIGALKQMATKAARLAKAVANTAKTAKGLMANNAANSMAATNTRNRPTAMHTTDSLKSRTQPR